MKTSADLSTTCDDHQMLSCGPVAWAPQSLVPYVITTMIHNQFHFLFFLHWKTLYASGVIFSYHQPETILFFSECLNLLVVLLHFFMNEHQDLVPCPPLVLRYSLKLIIPYTKHVVVHVMKAITTFSI